MTDLNYKVYVVEEESDIVTVCYTKEDADLLATRLSAANYPKRFTVSPMDVMRGDVQPRTFLFLEATVTDSQEVFVRRESSRLVWPFDSDARKIEAAWEWERSPDPKVSHGTLFVKGLNPKRVRELFKHASEMLRTDDDLRAKTSLRG